MKTTVDQFLKSTCQPRPVIQKAIQHLDSLKNGELIDGDELIKVINCSIGAIQNDGGPEWLKAYRETTRHRRAPGAALNRITLYGNKKTIAHLRTQLQAAKETT